MGLDGSNFESFFNIHYPLVLGYVMRRVHDRTDAEDVVLEAFLVVWRRRDDMPDQESEQRMWVYGVARNVLKNRNRSIRRSANLFDRVSINTNFFQIDETSFEDISVALEALAMLNEPDQELIMLSVWEELSHAEIAKVVGTNVANISVRLHRAKKKLKKSFSKLMQDNSLPGHDSYEGQGSGIRENGE